MQFEQLAHLSNRALEEIFSQAAASAPETLAGAEWRGYNIAPLTKLLGIQKFIKGFFLAGQAVQGYNIPVAQNGLGRPWIPRPSAADPRRYAFYTVTRVDAAAPDNLYPRALLLNYGVHPRNPRLGVERLLRDYLVQVDPENPDLMLGKAFFAVGPWRLFSNFFLIERLGPTSWMP